MGFRGENLRRKKGLRVFFPLYDGFVFYYEVSIGIRSG
jgi:hypothetical protein